MYKIDFDVKGMTVFLSVRNEVNPFKRQAASNSRQL
jgi:hypothetical protein